MKWPTDEQLDRAAETVAQVTRIPGLEDGGVVLPAETLDRVVRWVDAGMRGSEYEPHCQISVELPYAYDRDERLKVASRRRVILAMGERQDELEEWVEELKDTHSDASRAAAECMYEDEPTKLTAINGGK